MMSQLILFLAEVIGIFQIRCSCAEVNPSKTDLTEEWLADLAEYRRVLEDWRRLVEQECDISDSEDVWKYHNSNDTNSINDQYELRQRYWQERETYKTKMEFYKNFLKYCKQRICSEPTIASENIASTQAASTQPVKYTTEGNQGLTATSYDIEERVTDGDSATMTTRAIKKKTQIDVSTRSENDASENAWIVFQRRQDGSVDFDQSWDAYVNGFGDSEGEFWAGLEMIHNLTKDGDYGLRIDMIDTTGNYWYAEYSNFSVGSSQTNYILTIGGYSGNATDGMTTGHNQKQFSTFDANNDDLSSGNCAEDYGGGWWYNNCHYSLLNGFYQTQFMWCQPGWEATDLCFSEMKTRKSSS